MIKNQHKIKIQVFKDKNTQDFFKSTLHDYLQTHDIIHKSSHSNKMVCLIAKIDTFHPHH